MQKLVVPLFSAFLCCAGPYAASASSSPWSEVKGGAVRLVTSGSPDADGILRGALQIDLKPGWKTYWQDPGDTGVPPQISLTGASLAGVSYPVPQRFDDADAVWNGYEAPVSFALRLKVAGSGANEVGANIFLGICQSICIPLQAHLKLDPTADPENAGDAAVVSQAFDDVPAPARSGFRLTDAEQGKKALTVKAELPRANTKAELFVAAPEGYSFGPPKPLKGSKGGTAFSVPVYERPDASAPGAMADYTLVQDGNAVAGTIRLP